MTAPASPDLRRQLQGVLQAQLGSSAELVSVRSGTDQQWRGLAVCSGRLLSFVLDAQQQRLRTQPLLEILEHRWAR